MTLNVLGADKTALAAAIAAVNDIKAIVDAAEEGNKDGQYIIGTKTALVNAKAAADVVLSDVNASQKEVDDAATALNEALETFSSSKRILTTVSISIPDTTMSRKSTCNLSLTAKDQNGEDVDLSNAVIKYLSSDPKTVSIDNGTISAEKTGSADISLSISVNDKIIESNTITITVVKKEKDEN